MIHHASYMKPVPLHSYDMRNPDLLSRVNMQVIHVRIDDEELYKKLQELTDEYIRDNAYIPDTLYCSPMGYLKLQTFSKVSNKSLKVCYGSKILGMEPIVVPSLGKEFVAYNRERNEFMNYIDIE